ncbi:MAG: hypothetical protein PHQ23_02460 [Candidatus Wallbacteria bacterium]|nr:hypothetical protein [Candidatus Wallbacteria bacterium]
MIILAGTELQKFFSSMRSALSANIFHDPRMIIFLIICGLLATIAAAYFAWNWYSNWRDQRRKDLMVRLFLSARCGLNAREKSWVEALVVREKIRPTYRILTNKNLLKRYLKDASARSFDQDFLILKVFRDQ